MRNSAGGYAWVVDDWTRLDRFLLLGSEGGSYYASEWTLTRENAEGVWRCIQLDGIRAVDRIVEISDAGRAPKNDPAIFALAMAAAAPDSATRTYALGQLAKVARTGTHLFHFAAYVSQFRGWGRGLRVAIGNWYAAKEVDQIAYQIVKYQQRDGWSHRDLLRLSHPKSADPALNAIFQYVVSGNPSTEREVDYPPIIRATEAVRSATDAQTVASLIREYRLPREVVPTEYLNEVEVWDALLQDMPLTALIRNLANLTRIGLITPLSERTRETVARLTDRDRLRKARVHPIQLLAAMMTYVGGHSIRGSHTWTYVTEIVDALDAAFYMAFDNVVPTNKRMLLALDVSGSMNSRSVAGIPTLTPRIASAALALITAATEKQYATVAFSNTMVPLKISPRQRLDDVVASISQLPFSATDCALPMLYALEHKMSVDTFVIYTDSETWFGTIHPVQALKQYRAATGIPAQLVVVGMVSNGFSIADPNDIGMLDIVGFDTATPAVIADFSRNGV